MNKKNDNPVKAFATALPALLLIIEGNKIWNNIAESRHLENVSLYHQQSRIKFLKDANLFTTRNAIGKDGNSLAAISNRI